MFDFLRNFKDAVVAEVTVSGAFSHNIPKNAGSGDCIEDFDDFTMFDEFETYIESMGYSLIKHLPLIMYEIKSHDLISCNTEDIANKLNYPEDDIKDAMEAYSLMTFFKEKDYSALEAGEIIRVANLYQSNPKKSVDELSKLAECSIESVNSVISLLADYKNKTCTKPFTMENATPNSGQKPVVQPPKTTSSKTNKKTATAS